LGAMGAGAEKFASLVPFMFGPLVPVPGAAVDE